MSGDGGRKPSCSYSAPNFSFRQCWIGSGSLLVHASIAGSVPLCAGYVVGGGGKKPLCVCNCSEQERMADSSSGVLPSIAIFINPSSPSFSRRHPAIPDEN